MRVPEWFWEVDESVEWTNVRQRAAKRQVEAVVGDVTAKLDQIKQKDQHEENERDIGFGKRQHRSIDEMLSDRSSNSADEEQRSFISLLGDQIKSGIQPRSDRTYNNWDRILRKRQRGGEVVQFHIASDSEVDLEVL